MTNDFTELTPGIGHNRPVAWLEDGRIVFDLDQLREYLIEGATDVAQLRDQWLGAFSRAPKTIADAQVAMRMTDLAKALRAIVQKADPERLIVKEAFAAGGRLVDLIYRPIIDPAQSAFDETMERLTAWQKDHPEQLRTDLGNLLSPTHRWEFRDLDPEKIDLSTLRRYLPRDAIEKALRAFIRDGGREIDGAVIFENTSSQVR